MERWEREEFGEVVGDGSCSEIYGCLFRVVSDML